MPNWTDNQKKAIKEDGSNIIVSAGAGSGKTAVLTERVLRKLKNHIGIDKLLILTFTKEAANEMKVRIREEIKKYPELSSDLKKIDSSFISTFDSFSLALVRKYHYLLNVKRDINIIDSNLLSLKTKEFLDEIMEEEYSLKNEDFTKLITDFCVKDDKKIVNAILSINKKLDLKYDKKGYLDDYIDNYYSMDKIHRNIDSYMNLLFEIIRQIDDNLTKISYEVDDVYLGKLNDLFIPIINSKTYEEIRENVLKIDEVPSKPKGSSEEAGILKNKICKCLSKLIILTNYKDTNELIKTIELTKPYASAFVRIIKKLDEKLDNYKFTNDLYDFIDISKKAIKIVKDYPNIKEEIKNNFNEIMVDEYQDTSDLQEEFIKEISNNNVYTVGDVKQSIYRFRNANPDNFRDKYNSYSIGTDGKKIDLLDNFRSRSEVVDGINLIFNYIMDELIGGADYVNSHQMIFGFEEYEKNGKVEQDNKLEILEYPIEKDYPFSCEEIEAFIVAHDIKEKINNHFMVYDKKKKILREAKYSDFSILIDRSNNFDLFKKVFLYEKIPLSIYQDEKLTDSELFMVIRNIFKYINFVYENNHDKEMEYSFLSIGRSFLFDYTDEELFDIVTNNDYEKTVIYEKTNKILDNIYSKTISMILDEIIKEFDVYEKLRKIPNIESNYAKLEYMYTLSSNLNKMSYGFKEFDDFLEDILSGDNEIKFSMNKETLDSAKIMTIHNSKGLEYPICYFPILFKEFNRKEIQSRILYNDNLGIVTSYNDEGMDTTFYSELFKRDYNQNEVSEKIRLFYVAATRAREKMIFVMPETDKLNEEYDGNIVSTDIRLSYKCFQDMLTSIKSKINPYTKNIDLKKLHLTKKYNLINSDNLFDNINKSNNKIEIIKIPKINPLEKSESHFSKSNSKLFTKDEKDKMDFGTKIHYYLETLDLKNPEISNIEKKYQEKIESFLNIDLLKNINKAKVYQEYEFIEESLEEEKHGVIDLMLEYSDYIDIIDYKLKNIDDVAYTKQLAGYKNYIEKITNKKVNTYLYSIMDEKYQKV